MVGRATVSAKHPHRQRSSNNNVLIKEDRLIVKIGYDLRRWDYFQLCHLYSAVFSKVRELL